MTPPILDRLLLPLRLARARARGSFRNEAELGAPLVVEGFDLGFPHGEASYNAIGQSPDGTIWFAIGTKSLAAGARLFAFDPRSSALRVVADLDEALPAPSARAIPQGKVHVDLVPFDGAMLGATHIGYYDPRADVERPGTARGYAPYPGGWFFAIEHDQLVPLAQAPAGEGIITMSVDVPRRVAYALTWPAGLFLTLDLDSRLVRNHGHVMGHGRICRSLGIEPSSGAVFWSDERGRISRFDGSSIDVVATTPRAEMWRKVVWHPAERVFYGTLWRSSALFRFDPFTCAGEELGPFGAPPATLAFALDGDTLQGLVTGPGVLRPRRMQLATSVAHLAYDLGTGTSFTSGPLRLADGRWITQAQSLLLTPDHAYSLCWIEARPADRYLRKLRRYTKEYRTRGYAEEMMLVRMRR
jgi:hypothetical protein